jgi:hypothetical protein
MIKYKEEKRFEKENGQLVFSVATELASRMLPTQHSRGTKSDIQGGKETAGGLDRQRAY